MVRLLAFALALLAAVPLAAASADRPPSALSGADGDADRTYSGFIDAKAQAMVTRWLHANPHRDLTLHLDSRGGRAVYAMHIYDLIEARGRVTTDVAADRSCMSACVLIWLAGEVRTADNGALLGFHSAFCLEACDLTSAGIVNQDILDTLAHTEPKLAVMLSQTGAMITGNRTIAVARRENGSWTMRLFRPPPQASPQVATSARPID